VLSEAESAQSMLHRKIALNFNNRLPVVVDNSMPVQRIRDTLEKYWKADCAVFPFFSSFFLNELPLHKITVHRKWVTVSRVCMRI
jgi:hypothetical protein